MRAQHSYVMHEMQYLSNTFTLTRHTATMALSNKAMQTFSYMMLISLAASTCGGLGFLLYSQSTGQFSTLLPRKRAPASRALSDRFPCIARRADPGGQHPVRA